LVNFPGKFGAAILLIHGPSLIFIHGDSEQLLSLALRSMECLVNALRLAGSLDFDEFSRVATRIFVA
jgi:hypothetical protein